MNVKLIKSLVILFLVLSFAQCKKDNSSTTNSALTLEMGAGYINDVYYSLDKGTVKTESNTNWDIAFNTNIFSPTIITNGGAGIKLYTYPSADTSAWNTTLVSSTGWPIMYNSDTTWTFGAFQRNTVFSNPFDYGWGVYDQNSHDLIGDSLFVIQLQDQTYRKFWIKRKASILNKYIIQYANLDGTSAKVDTINCALYTNKNFIYYSIAQQKVVDREPVSDSWDFVATRYMANVPYLNTTIPYLVTGILINNITYIVNPQTQAMADSGVLAAKLQNVNTSTTDYSKARFSTNISTIGWDWANFNQQTKTYSLQDSVVYFVKNRNNKIYKILFTGFVGSSTGEIKFQKTLLN